jgi:thiamine-phosphate pyrophosphorylase
MAAERRRRLGRARLYLLAPGPEALDDWAGVLRAAVAGGADVVQLRMKGASTGAVREGLRRTRAIVGPDVLLLVNDDLAAVRDEAGALLADGLHLGRQDAAALAGHGTADTGAVAAGLAAAREALGPDLLLGTSTRTLEEVERAAAAGADHVGFGAMAVSATKRDTAPADLAELARVGAALPALPVFPIGGLGPANLGPLVVAAGCGRAAVGRAILAAPDPRSAARACRRLLERVGLPA